MPPPCSDKRGAGGQKLISGSVLVRLAAAPPPGCRVLPGVARLAYSYLVTPHTLELHTSGVLGAVSRDQMEDAHARIVGGWLAGQGQGRHALPEPLVTQVRQCRTRQAGEAAACMACCVRAHQLQPPAAASA